MTTREKVERALRRLRRASNALGRMEAEAEITGAPSKETLALQSGWVDRMHDATVHKLMALIGGR